MASAHIEIGNSRHAMALRNFVDRFQELTDDARAMKAAYDQAAAGADFAALATLLDLRTAQGDPDAARAETIYNLFSSVAAKLTETEGGATTFFSQLLSRMA